MTRQETMRTRITALLRDDASQSDRAVARVVGCDKNVVGRVRRALEENGGIHHFTPRRGRGHTTRVVHTPVSARRTAHGPWVYAIGPQGGGLTKIGMAWDVELRLAALQGCSPVPLVELWRTRGGVALERRLHAALAAQRRHGEWFDLGADPCAVIAAVLVHI